MTPAGLAAAEGRPPGRLRVLGEDEAATYDAWCEELAPGVMLPFSLDLLGAANCDLLVKPDLTWTTTTVGGGAGAGTASLRTPIPPVTVIIGMQFFTQWMIIDPLAVNGVLAVSDGQWHVIGP